jgi:hypothetical protein
MHEDQGGLALAVISEKCKEEEKHEEASQNID